VPDPRPPRLGLIGVGALGARHARTLAEIASRVDAPLAFAGVFDLDPARASTAAAAAGTTAFASADALCGACAGVLVVVPTVAHRAVAEAALARGCHVFVEKPIADSLAAADALLEHARAAGRGLWVGHSERFNPAVRAAAPHLQAPRYLEARRLAGFTPRATDVDVVLDLMIHDIDLALAITGERPSRVEAIGVAVLTESEDLANARLEFPSGTVASLTASRVSPEKLRKLRVAVRRHPGAGRGGAGLRAPRGPRRRRRAAARGAAARLDRPPRPPRPGRAAGPAAHARDRGLRPRRRGRG
jgi:predicted dehydrogenase